jgi:putative transposase
MTYYRRARTGNTFFFTLVSFHRRPILCDPAIRLSLRRAIDDVRKTRPFAIDAWVSMPDHLHCI